MTDHFCIVERGPMTLRLWVPGVSFNVRLWNLWSLANYDRANRLTNATMTTDAGTAGLTMTDSLAVVRETRMPTLRSGKTRMGAAARGARTKTGTWCGSIPVRQGVGNGNGEENGDAAIAVKRGQCLPGDVSGSRDRFGGT